MDYLLAGAIAGAVIWLFFALEACGSAMQRGHHWFGWMICGLMLGPLAWCLAMTLPDYRRQDSAKTNRN